MRRRSLALALAVVVACAVLAGACGADDGGDQAAGGDRLPAVELIALADTSEISLDMPAAAPRVINLWASWCAPCRSELPAFDEVATTAGASIDMLGVNVGESADTAAALVQELGIAFPQAVNTPGDITAQLGVAGLPATVFATADGEILEIHGGALDADGLSDLIEELLGVTVGA